MRINSHVHVSRHMQRANLTRAFGPPRAYDANRPQRSHEATRDVGPRMDAWVHPRSRVPSLTTSVASNLTMARELPPVISPLPQWITINARVTVREPAWRRAK